jgi:hypothetical protein
MTGAKPGRVILLALLGAVAGGAVVLGALVAILHSPWAFGRLARALGYEASAQAISLSPTLSGSISGLSVKSTGGDGFALLASNVTAKNSLDMILRGEIDTLVLHNPTFTLRIGAGNGTQSDLSFLRKVPKIRVLDIQNAEARLTMAEGQHVRLTGTNITIRNFSPETGGSVAMQTNFAVTGGGATALAASGRITASFQFTGVYPRPYGRGTIELVVTSGAYTTDSRVVRLGDLRVTSDMVYERQTDTFAITTLRGESKDFGPIEGRAKAVLRGDTPWSAALSVASIDFAQIFALLGPFLPEEYRAWTAQGHGAVETELQGTYVSGQPSFSGQVTLSFSRGGFSSPDSTTAAQGMTGRIVLKLQYAPPGQKVAFSIRSEESGGEYLWGKYYGNLAGKAASMAADGALVFGGGGHHELEGSFDVFQTGNYSFSATAWHDGWTLHVTLANVSHERIVETLLKASLPGLSPAVANLSVTGSSSLDVRIRRDGAATTIAGTYRMTGATLRAPDMQLAIQELAADVPFDLAYPPSGRPPSLSPTPGLLRLATIQRRRLVIDRLQVPLVIAQNALEVTEPILIPFFGGTIRLYGVRVDDVLFPTRYDFGVAVEGVDLGRLTRRLVQTEYPGLVNADLGHMTYQNNRLTSKGLAVIRVFGGEIRVTNFFAENVASPSRRIGGDITFSNIDLEEVTRKVAIGKMTGIVRGALRNLVMEYGEPASFVLEIESVETPGVEQRISTDAIQSISILGTGAGSVLNKGIARFFKDYPYSKIGLRCVLNNDQFSVNGTIREGGKEYLVRRGLLRGVDVVNQNPDNVISFRDMEERIRRISRPSQPAVEIRTH